MRDRLGKHKWVNLPIVNPTQNVFRRFVKTPGTGLPDYFGDLKKEWKRIENMALETRLEDF